MTENNIRQSRPVRIAVIEPSGALYGSEYCLLDILRGLNRSGIDWHVITTSGRGFDRLLAENGIPYSSFLPPHLHLRSRVRKIGAYWRLFRVLQHLRPDLIYVNQAGVLRVASWIANRLQLPIVCQVQTLEDARLISKSFSRYDPVQAFICNSRFIAAETSVDSSKKCVLYQGVASEFSDEADCHQQPGRPGDVLRIGILGRIAHSKGHYLLLDAAKELIRTHPQLQFVVIGSGLTAKHTAEFEDTVQQMGLSENFELRGYRSDLKEELSRLELLVIPSLAEPLGRVLFDAARYRLPVVVSDAGGLGELCRHFNIGETFESGNAEALATAILAALQNLPDVRRRFQTAAVTMRHRLEMTSYLSCIEKILRQACRGQTSNIEWLGNAQ